jgi:Putative MetA-pathway of phenol degradation
VLVSLVAAARLSAQEGQDPHAVQPERPTVATHAGTVAPGWLEIETGVEHDRFNPGISTAFTPTLFKLGLAGNVQLSVFGSVIRDSTATGVGDFSVGVKWRLRDDAPIVGDFAVLPVVKFPTGSAANGTGTGTTDASLVLISSHDFGALSMDVNVGYTRRSGTGSNAPVNASLWTISFGAPISGSLGWTAECYGYPATSGPAGQASIVALLGGPTFLVRKWLALDAGIIVPLAGPQPHALYAGGVYNVGRM